MFTHRNKKERNIGEEEAEDYIKHKKRKKYMRGGRSLHRESTGKEMYMRRRRRSIHRIKKGKKYM